VTYVHAVCGLRCDPRQQVVDNFALCSSEIEA
jgi:hypothetical protein